MSAAKPHCACQLHVDHVDGDVPSGTSPPAPTAPLLVFCGALMRAARLSIAVAVVVASSAVVARAGLLPCEHNGDMVCPVNGANDYEVVYTASMPFSVGQIYVGPSDNQSIPPSDENSFPPGTPSQGQMVDVSASGTVTYNGTPISNITVSGNGTDQVTVMYSGTTFSDGQWTHVGIRGTGTTHATIANAYWTINGVQVSSLAGHQAGVDFSGSSTDWLIVRVTDYDSLGDVIGHNWSEEQASGFTLLGNPGVDLYVSYATMISSSEIPLADLNEGLTGFGTESPIMTLTAPAPEPSSLVVASVGALSLIASAWIRSRTARGCRSTLPA
jgi:hypothetical protein